MNNQGLSIIVPTYNEADNVTKLARRIVQVMSDTDIPHEIIFVDDHSTDLTRKKIQSLSQAYPISTYVKKGQLGKGYSIYQGFTQAKFEHIAMIDADLQYPPEILPQLYEKAQSSGFSVANRKRYHGTPIRTFASRANAFVLGKLLLGLNTDVQSGLKVFHREVFERLDTRLISAWAIDIPLVHTAYSLGHTPSHVDIDFHPRDGGESKVDFLKTSWEIANGAIKTKFSTKVHRFTAENSLSMTGSGLAYRRKRYVTHTTLPHSLSALVSLSLWQKLAITVLCAFFGIGLLTYAQATAIVFTATISAIYFADVLFNLFIILKSLHFPPDVRVSDEDVKKIKTDTLPMYSVLCPLYKEASVLPHFIASMNAMDWPKEKLDILLLLEEDDKETIQAAKAMQLPEHFSIVIVPDSQPKTKPKACNFGLNLAHGEYIVVYDAEDRPDPNQLKKAYLAFQRADPTVACMQAKLNYYNPHDNLLTRLFTAEYSLWFDVVLPGLQSIQTTIPLGGTSNHFRTSELLRLEGWDPFNVTEDADLGARLFRKGYKTAIIDSTTLEEANSSVKNWFRQRSRWIKGYIQTYFVHFRNPFRFAKQYGHHAILFQLIVGGKIAFMLINPLLWIITVSYFVLYNVVGPTIESIYPTVVFYMAATSLVIGNFIYIYNYMIGVAKRNQWELVKYVFFIPLYWLMISVSAAIAVFQFIVKPYYWEKTIHGLHLNKTPKRGFVFDLKETRAKAMKVQRIADLVHSKFLGNAALIGASLVGNIFNFLYNAYLGRKASLEDFGLISLIGSFLYMAQVPLGALGRSVTHKSAFLEGKYNTPVKSFWKMVRTRSIVVSAIFSVIWLVSTPFLMKFFHTNTPWPFILFTPVWIIGTAASVDSGFLGGNLFFVALAIAAVVEALTKLLVAIIFVETGAHTFVFASIPISMFIGFAITWIYASHTRETNNAKAITSTALDFPKRFFGTSILTSLTNITYLSLDVLLAKHFLSANEAGAYAFLSLAGKMIYFLGSLVAQFLNPYVSRELGAGRSSSSVFRTIFRVSILTNLGAYLIFGVFGFITVPILWGDRASAIIPLLPIYGMAMVTYGIASLIITYHQLQKHYAFPIAGFFLGLLQVIGVYFFHDTIGTLATVIGAAGIFTLGCVMFLHKNYTHVKTIYRNIIDFLGLFGRLPEPSSLSKGKKRILIFNWRDIKHVWSGGAEVYIHELAKRWVKDGHVVTVFCGNDSKSSRYETIDGVNVIRRGGFYMVYLWACLYYRIRLRGKYDIIIDSENGLPFFTPLYAKEKIFLLIHHVHQEVFRKSLRPPFSWIALFLEKRVMPVVYRKTEVITVSPSSMEDILRHKLTKKKPHVIYNGVDLIKFTPGIKSKSPLVLYLGRLTTVKSIEIFIKAAEKLHKTLPKIRCVIAGEGQEKSHLVKVVSDLQLSDVITFTGKVSEDEKISLMRKAWAFVNPSFMEGWGITTIEANACGTPVVASNVPGLRDAVHNPHSGLLVPYGDIDEFFKAIQQIVTKTSLRKRMSNESRTWAEKFSWDKSANACIKVIIPD